MASPISPAIDGDVCDKDLFASPLDRDWAGFGDEDDDGSLVDDSSTVAGAIDEEDVVSCVVVDAIHSALDARKCCASSLLLRTER